MGQLKEILNQIPNIYNDKTNIKKIGSGESNSNYLLESKKNKYILRVPNHDRNNRLSHEFDILKLLPKNIAPQVYYINLDSKKPFMIQEFILGEHPKEWTANMLSNFSRKLAQIHKITKKNIKYYDIKSNNLDVKKYLNEINKYFFDSCSELKLDADIIYFQNKIENLIKSSDYLFKDMKSFSLIHGDLASINIFNNHGNITIIDWEFARYFDNAKDFATFCYDDYVYNNSKWRVKLSKDSFNFFINEYLKFYKDETLFERINFWIQIDKYSSLVYMKWKLYTFKEEKNITLSKKQIKFEIKKLVKSLNKHLSVINNN